MQQEPTPVRDDTKHPAPAPGWAWQTVGAAAGCLLGGLSCTCMCGHLAREALLGTGPAVLLAWWGFARRLAPAGRILAGAVTALVTVVFLRNLADIAWFGHSPLFP